MTPGIYFDLDGILCNFVGGAIAHHKADLRHDDALWGLEAQMGLDPAVFWAGMGRDYWAALEPYRDGMELLAAAEALVGAENVSLLSSPCDTDGCCDGKRAWVALHLPAYKRRLFLGSDKAAHAAPNKILVDDHDANVDAFRAKDGRVLQPPRPWNRLRDLCGHPGGTFDVAYHAARLAVLVDRIRNLKWV